MARSCGVCAEKDKTIEVLAEQIDWLRMQLGSPSRVSPLNPTGQPELTVESVPFLSEEEEDVRHMLEAGQITEDQLPDVLEALGFANTDIHFAAGS